jgi:hypothetical protein
MLAFGTVQQSNHCAREEFLYELKAGPAGGRLRRPSSAGINSVNRNAYGSAQQSGVLNS